jgi:hypothetical protein
LWGIRVNSQVQFFKFGRRGRRAGLGLNVEMRNGHLFAKLVGTFLELTSYMGAYQLDGNSVV